MSFFQNLEMLPDDPIFGLLPLYNADTHKEKINLSIGSYKDENGKPFLFDTVKKAEEILLGKHLNKEYQAFEGDAIYRLETLKLLFGDNSNLIKNDHLFCAQTIGASGALFLGAAFLRKSGIKTIAISNPTWSNHSSLMSQAGLKVIEYPYYDYKTKSLKINELCKYLKELPKNSAVLFHTCCHNPTGMDPSLFEWKQLAEICNEKQLIPFFDCAYQGFYENIHEDTASLRLFSELEIPFLIAYSYSKNFGLYGERAGALALITYDKAVTKIVESQIKNLIRSHYSSPPLHCARIVKTILTTPQLKTEWQSELNAISQRIKTMRHLLVEKLSVEKDYDFTFLNHQNGMFGFLGLNEEKVQQLRQKFGIFLPLNSRVNIAALNMHNIDYFVNSILEVLK